MKKIGLVAFLLVGVLLLAACKGAVGPQGPQGTAGPQGAPGAQGPAGAGLTPKTQTFDIVMGEAEVIGEEPLEKLGVPAHSIVGEFHRWEPDVLVVNKGDKVVLNVSNPRSGSHSLVLPAFGMDTGFLVARTGKKTVEFTANKAGVFQFTCGLPYDAKKSPRDCDPDHVRMVGYLIVLDR